MIMRIRKPVVLDLLISLSLLLLLREKCPNTELFLVRIFLYFDWRVNLRIQSEYRKIGTRKNSIVGHFSCSVYNRRVSHISVISACLLWRDLFRVFMFNNHKYNYNCNLIWLYPLRKISQFHLISWCGNFVQILCKV